MKMKDDTFVCSFCLKVIFHFSARACVFPNPEEPRFYIKSDQRSTNADGFSAEESGISRAIKSNPKSFGSE